MKTTQGIMLWLLAIILIGGLFEPRLGYLVVAMMTSFILGISPRHRGGCAICPMGTLQAKIAQLRKKNIVGLLVFLTILVVTLASCTTADYTDILVTKVFDGDTVQLASGEKVRLLGIDTPEMYESDKLYRDARRSGQDIKTIIAQGRKAYQFTKQLVEGKRVRLEFDREKKDKYGRLLAHLFIIRGCWNEGEPAVALETIAGHEQITLQGIHKDYCAALFVNASIISSGYANPIAIPPNVKYADLFKTLYRRARENKRGLWRDN